MTNNCCVTILVDNTSNRPTLLAEHGWAVWIEYQDHKILFDTGQSGIIQNNAEILNIDLSQTQAIVLSHGHYDHTGGLMRVLDNSHQTDLYLHPDATKSKYSAHPDKPIRNIAMPAFTKINLTQHPNIANLVWTKKPTAIIPGITVTGPIPRNSDFEDVGGSFFQDSDATKPDPITDDQSLFLETNQGLVVVLGCAHAGVVNTLDHIAQLTSKKEFHTIIGGMHLGNASPQRIDQTIQAFRRYNIQQIIPAHCTGTNAAAKLYQAFPDKCITASVGATLEFETTPTTAKTE
ncbi:MAG: MBL fold metallo-hydrolase [Sedimentisphaerales bacterium]|nr:MBL fold metallo-hydrolase [Sedimentisphaerales bacterium]